MSHKRYLGDSVYAAFDGWHIVLTTENGFGASNTICLEPAVYDALTEYAKHLAEQQPAMPWCEVCDCYHHSTAPHVSKEGT